MFYEPVKKYTRRIESEVEAQQFDGHTFPKPLKGIAERVRFYPSDNVNDPVGSCKILFLPDETKPGRVVPVNVGQWVVKDEKGEISVWGNMTFRDTFKAEEAKNPGGSLGFVYKNSYE